MPTVSVTRNVPVRDDPPAGPGKGARASAVDQNFAAGGLVGIEGDPREAGLRVVEDLKNAEGGSWTGTELKARFGLTPAVLHRRRKEHRIAFWRDARHGFHYPAWQFTEGGALRPGVKEVLQTFRSSDEWRVMRYFLVPRRQLGGRTPLALLRAGEVDRAVEHARVHAEENTW